MTECNRCGVTISGKDKRETENHCGFCSSKLGLIPKIDYGNMNVITDPSNATHFIFIGIVVFIGGLVLFSVTGSFDSYFGGINADQKIADTISQQELTPEFCEGLESLRKSIQYNNYSDESIKMIDAKLLECQFNEAFPDLELRKEPTR